MNLERWGRYSIAVNVALGLISLVIARASSSLAVEAEMVHNLVDLLTAVAVLIGLRLSTGKSKILPYGLYKLENVVAVVLAVMIFFTAYEIARDAFLQPTRQATVDPWMLGGVAVATAIPLTFSHFELRAGSRPTPPPSSPMPRSTAPTSSPPALSSPHCWPSGSASRWTGLRRWS